MTWFEILGAAVVGVATSLTVTILLIDFALPNATQIAAALAVAAAAGAALGRVLR